MLLEFAKIHGAGNDFVLIDDLKDQIELTPKQVTKICDRHFGVGADGVILVKPSKDESACGFMFYYNSDGTRAQMCGNGVRCFAKFVIDRELVDISDGFINVDTPAGIKHIEFVLDEDNKLKLATVNMGKPILIAEQIPTTLPSNSDGFVISQDIETSMGILQATCVSMGNPHCVIFLDNPKFFDNPSSFDIALIGSELETSTFFPEKSNIEFVYVGKDSQIKMRVWERGCGETLACGTGACATAVAANLTNRASKKCTIELLGGILEVELSDNGDIIMTGPAQESFTGIINI